MSSTVPNLKNITIDAKRLVDTLQDIDVDNNINSEVEAIFQVNDEAEPVNNDSESFSETSPFISSEMYKYLMKNNDEQKGGADHTKKAHDNDSSTSSTSSESKKENEKDHSEKNHSEKDHSEKQHSEKESSIETLEGGSVSYLSSSAHTEKELESSSNVETSISVADNRLLSNEINTEDINMISSEY